MPRDQSPPPLRYARIVDVPKPGYPFRLCLLEADRLIQLNLHPDKLSPHAARAVRSASARCALGDLVAFALDARGRLLMLEHQGGAAGGWREGGDGLRWRSGGAEGSRMAFLRLRGRLVARMRAWFAQQGFLEVETPVLVPAPTPEPQCAPIRAGEGYLITSPEFQLKRLLVGGFENIYRLGPVFRGGERGRHHNPEFTMLEWYRAQRGLEAMAEDLEGLLGYLAATEETGTPRNEDTALWKALGRPFARRTVTELFAQKLGMDIRGAHDVTALRAAARKAPCAEVLLEGLPEQADFEQVFFALWEPIQSTFSPQPLLVSDWPASLASLARLKPGEPSVAERMELYAGGHELANGFAELTDAGEQRRRFAADLATRQARGLPALPLDECFLEALGQGMPPAAGMALGVERVVMLFGGASHIRQVLPFAPDEL